MRGDDEHTRLAWQRAEELYSYYRSVKQDAPSWLVISMPEKFAWMNAAQCFRNHILWRIGLDPEALPPVDQGPAD